MLEQFRNAETRLGTDLDRIVGVNADNVLDLGYHLVRIRRRQIDLVQNRENLEALVNCRNTIGDTLRLDTLRRIDDQQRPFAGGQRPGYFVRKIDVPWRIDEVELVDFAGVAPVAQRYALGLDRNPALALQVHGIQHLFLHLPIAQAAAVVNEAVGQRRFAVVDMGDNGKISNVLHGVVRPAWLPGQSDAAAKYTDFGRLGLCDIGDRRRSRQEFEYRAAIQRVLADDPVVRLKNGHTNVEFPLPCFVGIDIAYFQAGSPRNQWQQFFQHHFTEMTASTRVEMQGRHSATCGATTGVNSLRQRRRPSRARTAVRPTSNPPSADEAAPPSSNPSP